MKKSPFDLRHCQMCTRDYIKLNIHIIHHPFYHGKCLLPTSASLPRVNKAQPRKYSDHICLPFFMVRPSNSAKHCPTSTDISNPALGMTRNRIYVIPYTSDRPPIENQPQPQHLSPIQKKKLLFLLHDFLSSKLDTNCVYGLRTTNAALSRVPDSSMPPYMFQPK